MAACSTATYTSAPNPNADLTDWLPPPDAGASPDVSEKPEPDAAACDPNASSVAPACAWTPRVDVTSGAPIEAGAAEGFIEVSFAIEGDVLVAGAFREGDDEKGAVYVLRRSPYGWRREARLADEASPVRDGFGRHVALSGDTLLLSSSRGVHMYKRVLGAWLPDGCLFGVASPNFITSVALHGDTAMVGLLSGAPYEGCFSTVLAFRRGRDGTWRNATVDGDDACGAPVLALTQTTALVAKGSSIRTVHVLALRNGDWVDDGTLPLGNYPDHGMTPSLALSADGTVAVVGLPGAERSAEEAGAVRVFRRGGCGWSLEAEIVPRAPLENGRFGYSVAIDDDALAVGSLLSGYTAAPDPSRAFLYVRGPEGWRESKSFEGPDGVGHAVALVNGQLIIAQHERLNAYGVAVRCMSAIDRDTPR